MGFMLITKKQKLIFSKSNNYGVIDRVYNFSGSLHKKVILSFSK